jgi:outer membrane autotransporter protein
MEPSRVRPKTLLLGGTALVGIAAAPLLGDSRTALAACNVFAPGQVFCATTTTTDTTFPNNVPNDRNYQFAVSNVTAFVIPGSLVDGFGLRFASTEPGGAVTVTNEGTVAATDANSFNGIEIQGNGGLATYQGNGSASAVGASPGAFFAGLAMFNRSNGDIQMGTAANPITGATFTGQRGVVLGILADSGNVVGNVSAFLSGGTLTPTAAGGEGIFLDATSGSGNATIVTTGATNIATAGGDFTGIDARANSGNVSINSDALIGSAGGGVSIGLRAETGGGSATVIQTAGGQIFANQFGILATTGTGGVSVTTQAGSTITMTDGPDSAGIRADSSGTGSISVTNDGNVAGTADFGIRTVAVNGATNIGNGGAVSGGLVGVAAESVGGPITISNTGAVTGGNGGILVSSESAPVVINTTGSITGINFSGIAVGSLAGPITVHATSGTVSGGAISPNSGISATTGGAGNIAIDGAATITGFSGIFAGFSAGASGSATVNTTGNITGTGGIAIEAGGPTTGAISVQTNGVVSGVQGGINVRNVGTGLLSVGVNGGSVTTTGGSAISAQTTGGANINIANSGTLTSPGTDTSAVIAASSPAGAIAITNNAGGVIRSLADSPSDLAIATSGGGPATIANAGTLTGRLSLGGSNNIVSNTGAWSTSGTNTLGGVFNNLAGGIFATSGSATIDGLSSIANAGVFTTSGITTLNGALSFTNSGTFAATGSVNFMNIAFSNQAGGTFTTSGATALTFNGASSFANAGTFATNGTTSISGLSGFANSGTFSANGTTSFSGLSSALDSGFLNSGTFFANGTTDFGGGNFSNSGIVNLANGSALNNLSNLQNFGTVRTPTPGTSASIGVGATFINASTGAINLQNGFAGDRLTIVGNYSGVPGSQLLLDFAPQSNTADLLLITGNASGSTAVAVNNLTPGVPFTLSPTLVQVNGTVAPNTFTLGTLQNFGAVDVVLLPGVGNVPGSVGLSLATVPSAVGLSGAAALQGAQTLAFQSNSAVLDQIWEVHELLRRNRPIGVPLSYADEDPKRAYAALPTVLKAPPQAAPVAAPAPAAARLATWARVYGDFEKRDNNIASLTFAGQQFMRDLSYHERGGGLLSGVDVVISNLTSASDALIFGPFGGYTTAWLDFKNAGVKQNFSGGTAGAKATYVNGGFFTDAIIKADLLSLDITATGLDQRSDLTNLSVLANVGYKFDLSHGFYVEPTAGVEYVRTDFSGSPLLTPTTVPLLDGNVTRLRAGARFGTEWVTNNVRIEPSVLPLVYYIADASGLETFTGGGPGVITFPGDEGKVFGEVQASVNFFDLNSGWSGFVRGDVRFGEDLIGGSGKTGIRYTW